jgi:hypothetical protein
MPVLSNFLHVCVRAQFDAYWHGERTEFLVFALFGIAERNILSEIGSFSVIRRRVGGGREERCTCLCESVRNGWSHFLPIFHRRVETDPVSRPLCFVPNAAWCTKHRKPVTQSSEPVIIDLRSCIVTWCADCITDRGYKFGNGVYRKTCTKIDMFLSLPNKQRSNLLSSSYNDSGMFNSSV